MNTRFKFRVWNGQNYVDSLMPLCINRNGSLICPLNGDVMNPNVFHIEQCTGLKDRNGKLIFEGDIVKTAIGEIGVVVFFDAQFAIRFENAFYCPVAEAKEIIGNIHEMESEAEE